MSRHLLPLLLLQPLFAAQVEIDSNGGDPALALYDSEYQKTSQIDASSSGTLSFKLAATPGGTLSSALSINAAGAVTCSGAISAASDVVVNGISFNSLKTRIESLEAAMIPSPLPPPLPSHPPPGSPVAIAHFAQLSSALTANAAESDGTFTYEAWVRIGSGHGNMRLEIFGGTSWGFYLINEGYQCDSPGYYQSHVGFSNTFGASTDGTNRWGLAQNLTQAETTGCLTSTDEWYHVAATYSSVQTRLVYYLNGQIAAYYPSKASYTSNLGSSVGAGFRRSGSGLRNVRKWSVARTQEQIRCYANAVSLVELDSTAGLDHWWTLHDSTDDLASGVAATGTTPTFSAWQDPAHESMLCPST